MKTLPMLRSITATLVGALLVALPAIAGSQSSRTIFHSKTPEGEVWISLELARHRAAEEYVPIVVAVRNSAGKAVTLDRFSFDLVGVDGRIVGMPDIDTLRTVYRKASFDREVLQGDGFPVGTRLPRNRAVPSEFFPSLSQGSSVRIDTVSVPNLYWTADLLYFAKPRGLDQGREVTLRVHPKGWEMPVKVRFVL